MENYKQNIQKMYQEKLVSPQDAIKRHTKGVRFISFGCYAATPVALTQMFAKAAKESFYSEKIDTLLFRSSKEVISFFNDLEIMKHIHLILPFIGGEIGALLKTAREHREKIQYPEYVSGHFSQLEKAILTQYGIPDVHMFQVSPMDEHGYFSFGLDGSWSIPYSRIAKKNIVEVNPNFPRTFGDGLIHISQIDCLVEHKSDLLLLPGKSLADEDEKIARYISELIPEQACIQLGIGGVPDCVGKLLKNKNDLSIHTELLSGSLIELYLNGNVTNKYKNIDRHHTVFNVAMLPSPDYYKVMDNNPSFLCYPASYVNNASLIAKIDNMISVNSFVEIDLVGQVASESINWKQITGTGGQVDFVRGASASHGGKSFLAAHSTTKHETISKIVPRLNNIVTTARTDVHYVVTEFGCANLFGMSNHNRALTLIKLAHPKFRDELTQAAKQIGLI